MTTIHTDKPTLIPFSQLSRTERNARRTNKSVNIEALAASIRAQGVLQNLVVSPAGDGTYAVNAGDRRYQAIALLIEQGHRPADFKVPCKVIDAGNATAASLAENAMREQMHPADEFDAFVQLVDREGFTIDHVADAFGVTPLVVERRLKLTKAAPELLADFREGKLSTDQLLALCATDDHETQRRVWEAAANWNSSPASLRRSVLQSEIDVSTDKRIPFIGGLQVYIEAGGDVRRDLFGGDGSGGFITDPVLLDELVKAKIEASAQDYTSQGWGWVEVQGKLDDTAIRRMGRIEADPALMAEEPRAKIEALKAEIDRLNADNLAIEKDEDESDEASERYEANEERMYELRVQIDEIEEVSDEFAPELKAKAGVILAYSDGDLHIIKGLIRTADREAVVQIAGSTDAVQGGRETNPAGRKNGNELSDTLRRSLLGHRNLAAQIVTASRPDVAKILLAGWTVERIRSYGRMGYSGVGMPTDLSIRDGSGTRTYHPITDDAGKAKAEAFAKACDAVVTKLPSDEGKLWDALAAMSGEELDALIAYGVALSVSLASDSSDATGKLIAALELDMAEHFTPTADNYFGKVSKELVADALAEGGDTAKKPDLLAMKKGELARYAETQLAGSGWVPKLIRTPKVKKAAPVKQATAKKVAPVKPVAAKKKAAPAKGSKQAPAKKASKPAPKKAAA